MKKLIVFLLAIGCFAASYAYAADSTIVNFDELVEKCAEKIIHDRVYIKPGSAFVAQKDIFLKIDEDIIPIDSVYRDKDGVFIYAYQLGSLVRCGTCKRLYDPEQQRPICPHRFKWE